MTTQVKRQAHELARFVVVGSSAVAVDFVVYYLLTSFVPVVPTSVAKATSFIAGAVLAFVANRGFVFRATGEAKHQIAPFVMLYLASLVLNNAVNAGMLAMGAPKFLAWLFATGSSTVSNFLGMKFIVFREKRA